MKQKEEPITAVISPMSLSDITKVREVGLKVPEFAVGTETPSFYSEEAMRKMVESNDCITLVARVEGDIVGFMLTSILPAARDAYIHAVAVTETYRRQGIAGQLIDETLTQLEARPEDCNHVFGDIQIENEASLKLFEKHGFQIGKQFNYIDTMLPRNKDS
ncbi:GNAT family N-acetyltransferase [Patescibacteria group bacterium]|nr:GNAT family N-acetyltransferase [Patescibacteria group bacterium]